MVRMLAFIFQFVEIDSSSILATELKTFTF